MLVLGQLIRQATGVMIEDQGYGGDSLLIVVGPTPFQSGGADQIADRFRAINVAFTGDHFVELPQQFFVDGNSETSQIGHLENLIKFTIQLRE